MEMRRPLAHETKSTDGPVVWEIPAGQTVGIVMDFWQRWQADFGLTGPDKGGGVKLLIVGPARRSTAGTRSGCACRPMRP
jgi:hypothetical protein